MPVSHILTRSAFELRRHLKSNPDFYKNDRKCDRCHSGEAEEAEAAE